MHCTLCWIVAPMMNNVQQFEYYVLLSCSRHIEFSIDIAKQHNNFMQLLLEHNPGFIPFTHSKRRRIYYRIYHHYFLQ